MRRDFIRSAGGFADENFFQDRVGHVVNRVGNLCAASWISFFLIVPLEAFCKSLFFGEGPEVVGDGFVVGEGGVLYGEKLTPLAGLLHVLFDAWQQCLVCFFCVLLVQDAVLRLFHLGASKDILATIRNADAVEGIFAVSPGVGTKSTVVSSDGSETLVAKFGVVADVAAAVDVFEVSREHDIFQILTLVEGVVAVDAVFAIENIVASAVFRVDDLCVEMRKL